MQKAHYCHFCGKKEENDLQICDLCGEACCLACISYTAPKATFPEIDLNAGYYCYRCIDNMIQHENKKWTDGIWSMLGKTGEMISLIINKIILKILPKNINTPEFFKKIIFQPSLKNIANAFSATWQSLSPKNKAKLIFKILVFIFIYAAINIYIVIPLLKLVANKVFILSIILFGIYIYFIQAWIVKHDRDGLFRRMSAYKSQVYYTLLILLLIASPLFQGLINVFTSFLGNSLQEVLALIPGFNNMKDLSQNYLNYFINIGQTISRSPFQIPK